MNSWCHDAPHARRFMAASGHVATSYCSVEGLIVQAQNNSELHPCTLLPGATLLQETHLSLTSSAMLLDFSVASDIMCICWLCFKRASKFLKASGSSTSFFLPSVTTQSTFSTDQTPLIRNCFSLWYARASVHTRLQQRIKVLERLSVRPTVSKTGGWDSRPGFLPWLRGRLPAKESCSEPAGETQESNCEGPDVKDLSRGGSDAPGSLGCGMFTSRLCERFSPDALPATVPHELLSTSPHTCLRRSRWCSWVGVVSCLPQIHQTLCEAESSSQCCGSAAGR